MYRIFYADSHGSLDNSKFELNNSISQDKYNVHNALYLSLNNQTHKQVFFLVSSTTHFTIHYIGHVCAVQHDHTADRGFEPRSGQIKDDKIGICCFSAKHTALRRTSAKQFSIFSKCDTQNPHPIVF